MSKDRRLKPSYFKYVHKFVCFFRVYKTYIYAKNGLNLLISNFFINKTAQVKKPVHEKITYSSVPNRRAVRNKRGGGKILEKH